jgi:hypothetical protein
METDRSLGLPPAVDLFTIARGRKRELQARGEALRMLRSRREAELPFLDEKAASANAAALNARIAIALVDGQLVAIEAALGQEAA